MVVEQFLVLDVLTQHIERSMPGLVSHLEDAGPLARKLKDLDRRFWRDQRKTPPGLPKSPGPYRDGDGPSIDDVRRYQAELEAVARSLPDEP